MVKARNLYKFEPDFAVPPGETLKETMHSLEMTLRELSARTGLTQQTLIRIFNGKQIISYETANKLELVTNVPASFWNNLEAQYREQIARIKEKERLEADLEWLKNIPTQELILREYIKPREEDTSLLRDVLKFYGVSSVSAWNEIWENPKVAAKRSLCFETRPGAASAWIRMGELEAQEIKCEPFNKHSFVDVLPEIRKLTVESTEVFLPIMKQLCAKAGVAFSLVREMKKVPWNGATKWLNPHKVMILLNIRGKGEDHFWFSFFHEAGHVLHDNKKDLLINDGTHDDVREVRADKFAAETLIPSRYNSVISQIRSRKQVLEVAKELHISPGIVVGRYHHLTKRWKYFNDLIKKYHWA